MSASDNLSGEQFSIHIPEHDREMYAAISRDAQMSAELDEHMRTATTDTRDKAAMMAHLQSDGHLESPHADFSLETLHALHREGHAAMDNGPEDEREHYTDLGHEHFHH